MNDRNVVLQEKQLSSAFKIFYLAIFLNTAYKIFLDLNMHSDSLRKEILLEHSTILSVLLYIFPVVLFFHFMRIYFTMEELEDPTSLPHHIYIASLGKIGRVIEQLVRLSVILLVSLKLTNIIIGTTHFNSLKSLFYYLSFFYFSLLFWDIFITLYYQKYKNNSQNSPSTYFWQDIICFVASLIFLIIFIFQNGKNQSIDAAMVASYCLLIIIMITLISFYRDGIKREQFFKKVSSKKTSPIKLIFNIFLIAWDNLLSILKHVFTPYYGFLYKEAKTPLNCPKNKSDCSAANDSCEFNECKIRHLH